MPSTSVLVTTEPTDISAADALNLTNGTAYTLQYLGGSHVHVTSQADAADCTSSIASTFGPGDWFEVTPSTGEGIFVWTGGRSDGYVILHSNIEPVAAR